MNYSPFNHRCSEKDKYCRQPLADALRAQCTVFGRFCHRGPALENGSKPSLKEPFSLLHGRFDPFSSSAPRNSAQRIRWNDKCRVASHSNQTGDFVCGWWQRRMRCRFLYSHEPVAPPARFFLPGGRRETHIEVIYDGPEQIV
jgi:hypothetical protein